MRTLADVYAVNRSFQKSTRIDSDLAPEGLTGYRLNPSGWHVLRSLAEDIANSRQRAFTWTGPYGSGKSSLALFLAAALGPEGPLRDAAVQLLGPARSEYLYDKLPCPQRGWMVVTVVGQRAGITETIWAALDRARRIRWGEDHVPAAADDDRGSLPALIEALAETAARLDQEGAGLLILVDEMGKLLEHAALSGDDLFPLQ
jgi:energy-coupling factor transporter ATP-binding protein EcfA2